jgi:thiamine biosynthesis lipoprotein
MSDRTSSVTFRALGSVAVLAIDETSLLGAARAAVQATIDEFDLACSRFREDSELWALNSAAGVPVRVSPLLFEATLAALRAARLTDGDVDPTVGSALVALGYDRDFAGLHSDEARRRRIRVLPVPGWRKIEVDSEAGTVRVPQGVTLDLGATAKALAADRAAQRAHATTGAGVLVALGGDIALAGSAPAGGWRVRVTDDHRAGENALGQWITLRGGGLATSSTSVRRWQAGARSLHHLIDPASGAPADTDWRTVSVAASSCLDANIASTAAMIRGQPALDWLVRLNLPSRLVDLDGRVEHLAGWPAVGDDLPTTASQVLA